MNKSLVFIHAFPLQSQMWKEQLEKFSNDYDCHTIDLPGFGVNPMPKGAFTFETYVDSFLEQLAKRGLAQSTWIGLSMGGYVALRAYERAPQSCAGLILCDTKSGADSNEAKLKRAGAIKALCDNRDAFTEGQWKALVGARALEDSALLGRFRQIVQANSIESIQAGLVALATRTDTSKVLDSVSVPTLVIVGSEDRVTPRADAEAMHSSISRSKMNVIEGVGHLSNLEAPEVFNQVIADFLASI